MPRARRLPRASAPRPRARPPSPASEATPRSRCASSVGARRASTLDLLVAGLGNPGREYERTRHNVGWLVVDELARRHGGSLAVQVLGPLAELRLDGLRLALLKPETYMNESGRSVARRASVLQGRARAAARRPRRRRPRDRPAAGAARRRPRRPQRPALDRAAPRRAGLPAPAHRRRPARARRPAAGRRLRAVAFEPRTTSSAGRPGRGRGRGDRARGAREGAAALQLTRTRHGPVTSSQAG